MSGHTMNRQKLALNLFLASIAINALLGISFSVSAITEP